MVLDKFVLLESRPVKSILLLLHNDKKVNNNIIISLQYTIYNIIGKKQDQ